MEQNFVVLQGKTFTVELQSMKYSSGYGWCLASLPNELVLLDKECIPVKPGIAPVREIFYFGAVSAENINVEIHFILARSWELSQAADTFTAKVQIVPSETNNFIPCSNNMAANTPFYNAEPAIKYGYPCGVQDANLKYGYPCSVQDANMKYGYPCGAQDANMKYGYPCQSMEMTKESRPYGYPFLNGSDNGAALKYGYPQCK